jgi:hydroxymethylglutaryl-CoA synthase
VALVTLADGADVLVFRTTDPLSQVAPVRPIAGQVAGGGSVSYGKYLAWRGFLVVEPPRRPEPGRVSASAAGRTGDWKFGLVGSRRGGAGSPDEVGEEREREGREDDEVRLPPGVRGDQPVEPAPMADIQGTVATFTVDRMAYSPSPPVVFAVVDFDGGGRLPIELTDVDAGDVAIGDRVEMTFRRLYTVDGIHNYFWKARPVRD